ncbi:MAG: heme lyase CcmF/NrfE family subunit, partial [Alphaproteobacteria bacterium]|nr:heme lyase CcmF/NrfE family subunit [Alphaproteobacteria bacterium]
VITELGHYALVLALGLAIVQSTFPFWGAQKNDAQLMALGPSAAIGQFVFMLLAFAALIHAFVISDFSVLNVAMNSHSSKPMVYKVAASWGNHEGSMVLWILILAFYGALVAMFGKNLPPAFRARVLAVQGLISVGFLTFTLFTSNPFERVPNPPLDGNGFNPILQDLALAAHPPMLYAGYVGFSMAYAFAIAALIEGRVDASWARWVRPWTLLAWCFLSFGIALGSYWAYYELGWGGWWFWDPVENASFMPWLAGTALLHSAIVVEKRGALKSWTILLAILAFSLSLLGTFLVRSGVLTSVHAFAVDPARGVYILGLLIVAIGGSLVLFAWRAPELKSGGMFAPISREGGLMLNNLLLATACATVLLGTLYPLILEAINGSKISVGAPYFNATFGPLMIPLLVAVPIGSMIAWKRGDLLGVLGRLKYAIGLSLLMIIGMLFWTAGKSALAVIGLGIAFWVIIGALVELAERIQLFRLPFARSMKRAGGLPRSAYAMAIAHIGLGVSTIGVVASSAWQEERILVMKPGDSIDLAGYDFTLGDVQEGQGPNFVYRRAPVEITSGGEAVATVYPEKRFYNVERQPTSEAGIDTTLFRDLYVVLADPPEGQSAAETGYTMRLYMNPLVTWIWGGVALMGVAGAVSLTDRRHRVGAPTTAKARREKTLPDGATA